MSSTAATTNGGASPPFSPRTAISLAPAVPATGLGLVVGGAVASKLWWPVASRSSAAFVLGLPIIVGGALGGASLAALGTIRASEHVLGGLGVSDAPSAQGENMRTGVMLGAGFASFAGLGAAALLSTSLDPNLSGLKPQHKLLLAGTFFAITAAGGLLGAGVGALLPPEL